MLRVSCNYATSRFAGTSEISGCLSVKYLGKQRKAFFDFNTQSVNVKSLESIDVDNINKKTKQ